MKLAAQTTAQAPTSTLARTVRRSAAPQRVLRSLNDRSVFQALSADGPLTRKQLCKQIGISKPAATALVERLMDAGIVMAAGPSDAVRPGPRAEQYALAPGLGVLVGVDVRHDQLRVRRQDLDRLSDTARDASTVVREFDEERPIAGQVCAAVTEALSSTQTPEPRVQARHTVVCIALPGAVDPATGDVLHSTELPHWTPGTADEVRGLLLGCQVDIDNEVNFRADAEQRSGSARGLDDFVLVALGNGVGAALFLDGQLRRGRRGAAGEIGYLPVGPDAVHFQEVAGAWNLAHAVGREHDRDFTWAHDLAALGRPDAWQAVARVLASGLASIAVVADPAVIVLAGELAHIGGDALRAAVATHLEDALSWPAPEVRLSRWGDEAVLEGCLCRAYSAMVDILFPPIT